MKKILKITGIIFLVIITVIVILIVIFSKAQSVPENYWEKIDSSSDIENRYNKLGKYEVEKKEYDAPKDDRDKNDNHFVVWYPKEKGTYPLVIMVNGTGVPCNKYEAVFKHFASWGYVVVGNDYGTNWDGKHPSETLDFALNTKEIADITDTDKIAIGGHSQGGMGAFNAINQYENGNRYKVLFSISPTNNELGISLQWGFDLNTENAYAYQSNKITIPAMLIAGTGKFDSETVSPLEKMEICYNSLNGEKVMFRRGDNTNHGNMLYESNSYIIAWLDYYLKNIKENEKAFFGDNAEIKNNIRYQDFKSESKKSESFLNAFGL